MGLLNAMIMYMRGQAHLQTGQTALADFDFDEALKALENYPAAVDLEKDILRGRAAMHREKRNFREMCANLERICGLGQCEDFLEARLRGYCEGGRQ